MFGLDFMTLSSRSKVQQPADLRFGLVGAAGRVMGRRGVGRRRSGSDLRAHATAGQRHGSHSSLQFGFLPKGLQPAVQRLDRAFGFLREDACSIIASEAVAIHQDQWAGARQIPRVVQHLCEFGIARSGKA